jgi:CheY-like chemotaxis protein
MVALSRVLVVDDQEEIRHLIMATLDADNIELYEADSGEEAWRLAQNLRPALILLDVMMPGALDGYQVCRQIKADGMLKNGTKVILLTGRSAAADIEQGKAVGCDAYLVKPFSPIELLDLVERFIPSM